MESIPQCNSNTTICQWIADLLDEYAVYDTIVQDFLAPADYWHDSLDEGFFVLLVVVADCVLKNNNIRGSGLFGRLVVFG